MPVDSKHSVASFSPNSTDLSCLRVAKLSRCRDLAIFFVDNDNNVNNDNDRILYPLRGMQQSLREGESLRAIA